MMQTAGSNSAMSGKMGSRKTAASSNANESMQGGPQGGKKEAKNNDWIPTQAVRAIL
jgi:hypothetical protein